MGLTLSCIQIKDTEIKKWCLFPLHLPIFMVFRPWCASFLSGKLLPLPLTKALDFKQDLDPRRWTVAANWSCEDRSTAEDKFPHREKLTEVLEQHLFITFYSQLVLVCCTLTKSPMQLLNVKCYMLMLHFSGLTYCLHLLTNESSVLY